MANDAIGSALSSFTPDVGILQYAWWLFPIVIIVGVIAVVFILKKYNAKKYQWTHILEVRRVMEDGKTLTNEPIIHKMRRFEMINGAEVFELEKALLGGYLFPELDKYSGMNKFSIILDNNNRIYTADKIVWTKDNGSMNVSAKHSEIDLARKRLKEDFQNINKVSKRIEWAEIAKWTVVFMALIVVMVLGIVGLTKWGESKDAVAQKAMADIVVSENMVKVMETIEATVNTQKLEITPMLKKLYGTENLQPIINNQSTLS